MKKGLIKLAAQNSIDEIDEHIELLKHNCRKLSGSSEQETILFLDYLESERDNLITCYDKLSNTSEETFKSSMREFKKLNYKLQKSIDTILNQNS